MKNIHTLNLKELSFLDSTSLSGGGAAEMVGLGIASAILFPYGGILGMGWAYYNFFKD